MQGLFQKLHVNVGAYGKLCKLLADPTHKDKLQKAFKVYDKGLSFFSR